MYFQIVSGSSSVGDSGLGKKRRVENESKLFIRLLSKRFLCRLHLNYYSAFSPVQFAFIFGAKLSNIKPFFNFAKPKDLGNVYNRKHFKTKQIGTLTNYINSQIHDAAIRTR